MSRHNRFKTKEELKYEKKINKRKKKAKKKLQSKKIITNYVIIRERSSGYVPLNKLNIFGKIANTIRYLIDIKYKQAQLIKQKQKEEEELLQLKIRLKKFILTSLEKVPDGSTDIILQIDYAFTGVLESVLNTTVELNNYDYEEVKMNKNYLKYIKKPHKLIMFSPHYDL